MAILCREKKDLFIDAKECNNSQVFFCAGTLQAEGNSHVLSKDS